MEVTRRNFVKAAFGASAAIVSGAALASVAKRKLLLRRLPAGMAKRADLGRFAQPPRDCDSGGVSADEAGVKQGEGSGALCHTRERARKRSCLRLGLICGPDQGAPLASGRQV